MTPTHEQMAGGCPNTHQPPIYHNKKPSLRKASVTTELIVCQTRHNQLGQY